jgi:topoisomerase-4 subunit A
LDEFREPLVIEADEFTPIRSFKAHGRRLTTHTLETVNELEPTPRAESLPEADEETEPDLSEEAPTDVETSSEDRPMTLF